MTQEGFRLLTATDLARMNLPETFWRSRLDLVPADIRPTLQKYIDHVFTAVQTTGFLFCGPSGSGKTSAASVLLKTAKAYGKSAYFTRVSFLRDALRSERPFSEEMSVAERCRTVDVLCLDDLIAEDATLPYMNAAALSDLVLFRGERRKSTILTTEVRPPVLKEAFPRLFTSCSRYLTVALLRPA